jgi:hypothetical protein
MAKEVATEPAAQITPDDLRAKFQGVQDELQGSVEAKKPSIAAIAGGSAVVLMLIMFFLGKRAGKKKSTIVEIRRV